MWVLGLNGPPIGWHDGAACLVDGNGKVWAMAEEERFTRSKHALRTYPVRAVQFCLESVGIEPGDLDAVAIGWDLPRLYHRFGSPWGFGSEREFLKAGFGWTFTGRQAPELVCVPHHRAHAASAFHASGHGAAAVLVNDGNGEDESISIYEARTGEPLVRREVWPRSHSIGYLYDATCRALGLTFLEAGKTMGLAAYGRAAGVEPWPTLRFGDDGFSPPFELGPDADYEEVVGAWEQELRRNVDRKIETPSHELDRDPDAVRLAWSAQVAVERAVLDLVERARAITGIQAVCIAGGVGLNCSANGLIEGDVFVPPVAHDAGGALGAAWAVAPPSAPQPVLSPYLGPEPGEAPSAPSGWSSELLHPDTVAERVLEGQVGGVAWGRAEVGPRALGHRSIIALPSSTEMRDRVNRLKSREAWRPLAPIGLESVSGELWRGPREPQRYMLAAAEVTDAGRERIAGTVHVDGTARAQVADDAGFVAEVLRSMESKGADPVLINTAINGRGEPIVNTAAEAVDAAVSIGLDFVVAGETLLTRASGD